MATNTLLTISMITRKALQLFRNSNAFLKAIDRQYDDSYAVVGAKIGDTLRIRLPNDYAVRDGQVAAPQATIERNVSLVLGKQRGVDVQFSSKDLTLSLDDYSSRILEPQMNNLAGNVAVDVMQGAENIPNAVMNVDNVSTNNVISPTASTWLAAGAVLSRLSAPRTPRNVVFDPLTEARTVSTLAGLFNPAGKISDNYNTAMISPGSLGFANWSMDQNVITHVTGAFTGTTLSAAVTVQGGNTLTVTAIGAPINAGDIITISNVYSVNRVQKQVNTGTLAQFVVTAAAATGATTLTVYPEITGPNGTVSVAYQTVDSLPANGATVAPLFNPSSSYRKNFVLHAVAATMATADLQMPSSGVVKAARAAYDGISIRVIQDYITLTDQWLMRTDILFGWVWPRPEWACIVADAI